MSELLYPCSIVGSYPQPDWLIDRVKLASNYPPRVRIQELWRVPQQFLQEAQDDATRLAVRDQELAGLDIVTDGEIRRESYSNHFANALEGIDIDRPGEALDRSGTPVHVPRVVGPIELCDSVCRDDVAFLHKITDRKIKITVPGPFTMSEQAQDDYYDDKRACALAYADAVNKEIRALFSAGADVVQIDEPYMQARPERAREYGLEALARALKDVEGTTCIHICFGYAAMIHDRPTGYSFLPELKDVPCDQISIETAQSNLDCKILEKLDNKDIVLGVLDLSSSTIESPETIVQRVKKAISHIEPKNIILAPDCGMKYLDRNIAFGKLQSMSRAAELLREHN